MCVSQFFPIIKIEQLLERRTKESRLSNNKVLNEEKQEEAKKKREEKE